MLLTRVDVKERRGGRDACGGHDLNKRSAFLNALESPMGGVVVVPKLTIAGE